MRRTLTLLLILLLAAVARPTIAGSVPAKNQALLLLRILAYDRNLSRRVAGSSITIVVVYKPGLAESEQMAIDLVDAVKKIGRSATVAKNAVRVQALAYSERTFALDVAQANAGAVYVCPGLGDRLAGITAVTRRSRLLSFGGARDLVTQGLSIGFSSDEGKAAILVNLPASRTEGADLDVALLRVATIVKK